MLFLSRTEVVEEDINPGDNPAIETQTVAKARVRNIIFVTSKYCIIQNTTTAYYVLL